MRNEGSLLQSQNLLSDISELNPVQTFTPYFSIYILILSPIYTQISHAIFPQGFVSKATVCESHNNLAFYMPTPSHNSVTKCCIAARCVTSSAYTGVCLFVCKILAASISFTTAPILFQPQ